MSHTFYNSLDLTCKSPFGAVKAGQPVTFNLTVPEDLGYVDPHLVLTKDCEDPVHYRMEFTGQTPKVNHFALTVTPTTSGLYFYHFDLYTDFRRIYRTPGGEGVLSWTDGQDWQLTVYEPDFKTPDWLKNGTMYQIFPDRFCEGKPNKAMPFADRIYRADKTGEPYFWPTEQCEGYLNMDYYGGDFAGIQQKLPYLRDLGVTCIYLNPILRPTPTTATTRRTTSRPTRCWARTRSSAPCAPLPPRRASASSWTACSATRGRIPATSTARADTARAARTGTAALPTAAGTTLTRAIPAATAAGGALRRCPRCRRNPPPTWNLSAARAASSTPG